MLLESKKVKIEGLGTFYCTLENQKNGALKKEDFNVNKHLKARRSTSDSCPSRRPKRISPAVSSSRKPSSSTSTRS